MSTSSSRVYSLAYLTTAPMHPPEVIHLAHKLGYGAVGIRLLPAVPNGDCSPLGADKAMMKATKQALKDTGVSVFDVEIVRLNEHYKRENFKEFLHLCGELNAKAILTAGDDRDEARLIDSYADFCEAAAPYHLTADLEFMPWTAVPDAQAALRIVQKAGQKNAGILVDAIHFARSKTTLQDIAAIPRALLHYAQICDAPAGIPATTEEIVFDARCQRLLPGQGGIDLKGLCANLPHNIPISIELPHDVLKAKLGVEEWARQGLAAAKSVLAVE